MAFTPGESDGALNGTTAVTVVATPSSGQRVTRTITVANVDTAAVTVILQKVGGSGTRRLWKRQLQVDETGIWEAPIVLTAGTRLELKLTGAPATTQPDWTSSWADQT